MTVQSLIDKLAIQDPNLEVCIHDADTSWLLQVDSVTTRTLTSGNHVIALEGEYGNELEESR